jgi:hypothetical protein
MKLKHFFLISLFIHFYSATIEFDLEEGTVTITQTKEEDDDCKNKICKFYLIDLQTINIKLDEQTARYNIKKKPPFYFDATFIIDLEDEEKDTLTVLTEAKVLKSSKYANKNFPTITLDYTLCLPSITTLYEVRERKIIEKPVNPFDFCINPTETIIYRHERSQTTSLITTAFQKHKQKGYEGNRYRKFFTNNMKNLEYVNISPGRLGVGYSNTALSMKIRDVNARYYKELEILCSFFAIKFACHFYGMENYLKQGY